MPDVRTQIANMVDAYDKYIKAKQSSAGVAAVREKQNEVERGKKEAANSQKG